MIPVRATYRVQFNAAFGFADGAALVPYLAALGISHLYASPVFAARTGSTHGYDITDYNRLNPALGTEAEFHAMAQALHDRGMGLILDVVPNHMGIGGADNPFWENVLEWGPDSPYAAWFDIDWHSPVLDGKLLFPFLGKPYATVLAEGGLALRLDDKGRLAIWAHDAHRLPICPRDYACVLAEAGSPLAGAFAAMGQAGPQDPGWSRLQSQLAAEGLTLEGFTDPERLDALIRRQHWRAAKFTLDADAINYRRFFTISDLAGVRVESPSVFAKTHAYVLSLIRDGWVDGLRIDHIDGLRDPKAYCLRLQDTVGRPFPLYVEKILGPQEALPADWQTDGTTGYEFANEVVTLLADPAGTETLTALYHEVAGHDTPPENVVHAAKIAVLNGPMRAEREAVLCGLLSLAGRVPEWADLGRGALREGLVQTIAALDIYRTYADATGLAPEDRARLAAALDRAAALAPELDPAVWEALSAILTLDLADRLPDHRTAITEAVMRFQQLTGPVMAKGLEDRALYRFNRLLALNEVGAHPGQFTLSVAAFHRVQLARQASLPQTMLGTSSHDTKRGEDARMRIVSLTSHARLWRQKTGAWLDMLQDNEAPVDRDVVYALLQILVGVWPDAEVDLPLL
jgi:(1->4)-alpha-D-glucan 1-alpha-D-glucosylmutase